MNRGEIWRMTLESVTAGNSGLKTTSAEENTRLVVIISNDALAVLPLRVVVPLIVWKPNFSSAPWLVRVPPVLNSGLEQPMAADALQVRSVSTARLQQHTGNLPDKIVAEISLAVSGVLQI